MSPPRRLTIEQVIAIKQDPRPAREIARWAPVCHQSIAAIRKGLIYKRVGERKPKGAK